MIELNSKAWSDLKDAYGDASHIPPLIAKLKEKTGPKVSSEDEPWNSLWSRLYHQDDIFSASFATVPYLAEIAMQASPPIAWDFFLLPVSIEIQRVKQNVEIPHELMPPYFKALEDLARLAKNYISKKETNQDLIKAAQAMLLIESKQFSEAENLIDPED
jgi:hypothetical protein